MFAAILGFVTSSHPSAINCCGDLDFIFFITEPLPPFETGQVAVSFISSDSTSGSSHFFNFSNRSNVSFALSIPDTTFASSPACSAAFTLSIAVAPSVVSVSFASLDVFSSSNLDGTLLAMATTLSFVFLASSITSLGLKNSLKPSFPTFSRNFSYSFMR